MEDRIRIGDIVKLNNKRFASANEKFIVFGIYYTENQNIRFKIRNLMRLDKYTTIGRQYLKKIRSKYEMGESVNLKNESLQIIGIDMQTLQLQLVKSSGYEWTDMSEIDAEILPSNSVFKVNSEKDGNHKGFSAL